MKILISAGEASGDLYASRVVEALRARHPDAEFFGCAGPRMQAAGVRPIVDSRSLAVVGIVEVLAHIPRIYGEFRKLLRSVDQEKPDLAVLSDSPDFHLRLAKKLRRKGVPVVYLIAPQVWAWREHRVRAMRRDLKRLLCIFPFEQAWFEKRGVPTTYIGHPLSRIVKPTMTREEFCAKVKIPAESKYVVLLPGSRHGESARHMPDLLQAAEEIGKTHEVQFVLALPPGFGIENATFWEPIRRSSIKWIEGYTWDALAHAEAALAASGTVTIEAALLHVPMVTFYRVNALSWFMGRWLVKAPFLSMVNLVAERQIVPELIQHDMTVGRLAGETAKLLDSRAAREGMKAGLKEVSEKLKTGRDPMETAAEWVERVWRETKGT
jgi:lipid-A-disaccharide synthase